MPSAPPAIELLPPPEVGRVFTSTSRIRLGDVDRRGRLRLDATARIMQDAATDDAADAALDRGYGWLVRRTLIDTTTPARLGEPVEVSTWCTGIGRSWAERRTSIVGERGARVDAVSLWVQIDLALGRPARIGADFLDAYAAAAAGRVVSARLALGAPDSTAAALGPWTVRRTDLDPYGHVNNAATWSFLEEAAELDMSERIGRAQMEYAQPLEADGQDPRIVCAADDTGRAAWLVDGDDMLAAAHWAPTSP